MLHSSKLNPHGSVITRHEHCANNPSGKDELSFDEAQYITEIHFSKVKNFLVKNKLSEFPNADVFDQQIQGWVHYWNEVFQAKEESLDPNLVKALIASESSFKENQKNKAGKIRNSGYARGLMQITDNTLKILGDHHGELKNYFISLTDKEVMNSSANICAGVRWLFRKKITATERLHHAATWEDAVAEYKGV